MDFMNLNQSAHGDREFGFIVRACGSSSKIVVGHWQDGEVIDGSRAWSRAACAAAESRTPEDRALRRTTCARSP